MFLRNFYHLLSPQKSYFIGPDGYLTQVYANSSTAPNMRIFDNCGQASSANYFSKLQGSTGTGTQWKSTYFCFLTSNDTVTLESGTIDTSKIIPNVSSTISTTQLDYYNTAVDFSVTNNNSSSVDVGSLVVTMKVPYNSNGYDLSPMIFKESFNPKITIPAGESKIIRILLKYN